MRAIVAGIVASIVVAVVAVAVIGGGSDPDEQAVGETTVTEEESPSAADPATQMNEASEPAEAPEPVDGTDEAVESGEEQTLAASDPEPTSDGPECPGPVPGFRVDAWVSSFSDGQVTEGEQVGETFVMVNVAWMDLPASGGATAGAFNLSWTDGTDFLSAATIFAPVYPDSLVEFDAASGELSGEVNVGTSANGDVPVMTAAPISGVLEPDGTVSGVIAHPEVDLSFDGMWSESEFRHPSDPACLATESEG